MNPTKIVFDTDKFMNQLQTYSQALNESLKKDLKSQMEKEINSKISSKKATLNSDTLNKFKKNLTVIKGSTLIVSADALPEDIYKKLITSDKISASDYITMNAFDDSKEFLEQVSNYINAILDSSDTAVNVGEKKYKISRDFGNTVNLATVKDITSDINYIITWDNKNNKNSALETLKDFLKDLVAYEKNSTYRVVKNSLIDLIYAAVDDFIGCFANKNATVQSLSSFLKNSLAGESSTLNSIGYSINKTEEFFKAFFPQTDSGLTQIQKNYKTFAKYEAELEKAVSKLKNPDADTIKNLTAYKNFLSAYETLSGKTLNISPEDYVTYYFKEVHNAEITQIRASIVGTSQVDSIISEGKNSTIYGESGNDALLIEGDYSKVYGGADKDSIIIAGNNSEVQGDAGDDNIIITGANVKAEGGYGQDTIWVQGSNITVTGDGETFDYLPIGDTFIIDSSARNILITDFEKSADKLQLNFSDIVVDLILVDGEQSLVILTSDKYEKIATLQGVNESSFNNIIYNGITTSIDWLLENKKFTVKNPYENIIQVKNNNLENSLSGVQIQAESGNNTITNKGSKVTISAGTGNDSIRNYGYSVIIDAGVGNDKISNSGNNATISGGAGDDSISCGSKNTVDGGAGDDSISCGSENTVDGGAGDDSISCGSENTVDGGAGDDSIYGDAYCYHNIINGGLNNDYILILSHYNTYNTIGGGVGNDCICGGSSYNLIEGNEGNDSIYNGGSYNTITGGLGNDFIEDLGSNNLINGNDGDDYIYYRGFSNTVYGGIGDDSIYNGGSDNIVTGGLGNDSIYCGGSNNTVYGGEGDDFFTNSVNDVNHCKNVIFDGGSGDDSFYNIVDNTTIYGGDGNDSICNSGCENTSLLGGDGDDSISTGGFNNTLYGGLNNDFIEINRHFYSKNNVIVYKIGDGDDTICGLQDDNTLKIIGSSYTTIKSGSGIIINVGSGSIKLENVLGYKSLNIQGTLSADTVTTVETAKNITNTKSNTIISGTKYADTISNSASRVTIEGAADNDSITSIGDSVSISGGAGNDTLYSDVAGSIESGSNVTITGGTGNDYISNDSAYSKLEGNDGKDTIINYGWNTTIDGGTDDDIINNFKAFGDEGNKVSINGGAGNDTINSYGKSVTISGGAGNDKIISNGTLNSYLYSSGDGNDTITGFTANDTIYINSGKLSSASVSGSNICLTIGNGSILLTDAKDKNITVKDSAGTHTFKNTYSDSPTVQTNNFTGGNDFYSNSTANTTLNALGGKDSIYNYANKVLINGGAGNDYLTSFSDAMEVTLQGDAGNDAIYSWSGKSYIDGGAGADYIYSGGSNHTIIGGKCNDSISLTSVSHYTTVKYTSGDGKDKIYGLDSDDTLQITGSEYTTAKSGSDFIIGVGSDSISVVGGANVDFKINGTLKGGDGISVKNSIVTADKTFTGKEINLANYDATKVNASAVLQAVSIVGTAVSNSIKGGKGADTISGGAGNDTVSLGGGNDVYIYSCGNDLIQDYKSEDKIKLSGGSITGASVSSSNVILNVSSGGKISVKGGKGKNITIIDSSGKETTNIYPLETIPAGISIKGAILTASTAFKGKEINVADYDGVTKVNAASLTSGVSIVGDSSANSIKGGKGADTIFGGVGNDTVSLGGGNDVYIYTSGNDLIQDYKAEDKIKLSGSSITGASVSSSNVILNVSSGGKISVKGGKGKNITIIDGTGKETTNIYPLETLQSGLSVKGAILTASTAFKGKEIDIADYDGVTKVNASAVSQAVSIVGTAAANSIKGGKGADTISGGVGNDTVSLGGGNDVYIYSGGNDLIQDYTFGQDKIKLSSGTISGASISGNDVLLRVGNGSINVKNGKGKNITILDSKGTATVKNYDQSNGVQGKEIDNRYGSGATLISGGAGNDTICNSEFFVSINGGAGDDWIDSDADNVTINGGAGSDSIITGNKYVSINGGEGNDWIADYGGYNVTISGGKGNDTIRLGSYYESARTVIKYASGDGDDVISNVNDNDTLQITGSTYTTMKSGSDVIFKVGNGSITVENGLNSGFNIDFISSSFNNSRTLDLMYDNNFMTNELQIDDISEVSPLSYSVGQIEYSADNNNVFRVGLIVQANDCNKK